jgi:hypothetical protein
MAECAEAMARIQAGEDIGFDSLEAHKKAIEKVVNAKEIKERYMADREAHKSWLLGTMGKTKFVDDLAREGIAKAEKGIEAANRPGVEEEIMSFAYKEFLA